MIMRTLSIYICIIWLFPITLLSCDKIEKPVTVNTLEGTELETQNDPDSIVLKTGAEQVEEYISSLLGKRVGVVVNQTSTIREKHLVDVLLERDVTIQTVFAPEHGFRGTADAGEKISDSKDTATGLPIISLYGKNRKPTPQQLSNLDIVVFDIQDVGARFYTYISTMHYVMEAAAEQGKPVVILDRPNPNGHYVDGPVLDPDFKSFVGMHPVPVVHGMTIGEYAQMINGEKWLANGIQCELTVIPVKGYDHYTRYDLPIKPSPNLPNATAVALYPSLCFFEGTTFSIGRGTSTQFQVLGHPKYREGNYSFTPVPMPGAKYPKLEGKLCTGSDLTNIDIEEINSLDVGFLVSAFRDMKLQGEPFFLEGNFFDKLAGSDQLRKQLISGMDEIEISDSWQDGLEEFKLIRQKYLLYKY